LVQNTQRPWVKYGINWQEVLGEDTSSTGTCIKDKAFTPGNEMDSEGRKERKSKREERRVVLRRREKRNGMLR